METVITLFVVPLLLFAALCVAFFVRRRRLPFVGKRRGWSIGIMTGSHPLELSDHRGVRNPVLTYRHVTDVDAAFVADPFLERDENGWSMFFEVLNRTSGLGEIGLARSVDGLRWKYERIVLREPFHLSFPYVFSHQGHRYMVPECCNAGAIRLYEAAEYPYQWVHRGDLIQGEYVDPTPFVWNDRWYMMAKDRRSHTLRLFQAESLCGTWSEHPESPIRIDDPHYSRPAGNVMVLDDRLYRYAQDYVPRYGSKVWGMEITALEPGCYREKLARSEPIVTGGMSGRSWNSQAMHQISPVELESGKWMAAVDGYGEHYFLRLRP